MKIKSDEITSVIKQEIEQYSSELEISEVGQVVDPGLHLIVHRDH